MPFYWMDECDGVDTGSNRMVAIQPATGRRILAAPLHGSSLVASPQPGRGDSFHRRREVHLGVGLSLSLGQKMLEGTWAELRGFGV